MSIIMKKTITAALGALTLGATIMATATPADAQWRGRGGGWGWRGPALVGGLALGGLAAGAMAQPYYAEPYPYNGGCYLARQPVVDRWGNIIRYRRVRVCE